MTAHLDEIAELACRDSFEILCGRCRGEIADLAHVAMMTRLTPGAPFEAWCVDCAYQVIIWARRGADAEFFRAP